jgi:DNA polymerase III epsilon subunit-like protein
MNITENILNLKYFIRYFDNLGIRLTYVSDKNETTFAQFGNYLKNANRDLNSEKLIESFKEDFNNFPLEELYGIGVDIEFNKLCCIDLDNCLSDQGLELILETLGLNKNYPWLIRTGSRTGFHILIKSKWQEKPPFDKYGLTKVFSYYIKDEFKDYFEKVDFLWANHSLLPPSIHKSGKFYEFYSKEIPSQLPDEIPFSKVQELFKLITPGNIKKNALSSDIGSEYFWESLRKNNGDASLFNNEGYYKNNLSLIIDIESTGLIPKDANYFELTKMPHIIQLSWIITDGDDILFKESSLIKEVPTIEKSIELYTGIDNDLCEMIGRPLEVMAKLLIRDLNKVKTIVSHNIDFDMNLLKSILFKCGIPFNFNNYNLFCTMKEGLKVRKFIEGYEVDQWLKLEALFTLLYPKVELSKNNLHNSDYDVLMVYKCYTKLMKLVKQSEFPEDLELPF